MIKSYFIFEKRELPLNKTTLIFFILLFTGIGIGFYLKSSKNGPERAYAVEIPSSARVIEIETEAFKPVMIAETPLKNASSTATKSTDVAQNEDDLEKQSAPIWDISQLPVSADGLPDGNRIDELFNVADPKLSLVETITYQSKVAWHKGSPAWIGDYASHYQTSKHFIARSLNGKPDYFKQDIADGNRFNIYKPGKEIEFYLLVDVSRCKMWLYSFDGDVKERILLKTYDVGLGRPDPSKKSGLLTPLGTYTLGNRIATYKPQVMGNYKGKQTEMIRVFGTRWIPFEKEVRQTTESAKGFGLHGVPWMENSRTGELAEDTTSLKKYESDGCIRMASADIEEIYAIVITKPATIILVKEFDDAVLPGQEILP